MKQNKKKAASKPKSKKTARTLVNEYDTTDVSSFVNQSQPLKFSDLGLELPAQPPTQVVSIRLPTELLNEIKAFSSQRDIPYQAMIKLFLSDAIAEKRKS